MHLNEEWYSLHAVTVCLVIAFWEKCRREQPSCKKFWCPRPLQTWNSRDDHPALWSKGIFLYLVFHAGYSWRFFCESIGSVALACFEVQSQHMSRCPTHLSHVVQQMWVPDSHRIHCEQKARLTTSLGKTHEEHSSLETNSSTESNSVVMHPIYHMTICNSSLSKTQASRSQNSFSPIFTSRHSPICWTTRASEQRTLELNFAAFLFYLPITTHSKLPWLAFHSILMRTLYRPDEILDSEFTIAPLTSPQALTSCKRCSSWVRWSQVHCALQRILTRSAKPILCIKRWD